MSLSMLEQYRYTISDIKLMNPPATTFPWHKPIFLMEIVKVTGNSHERLESAVGNGKNNLVIWSEQILYNVAVESTITFKVLMKKGGTDDSETVIGEYTNSVSDLFSMQTSLGFCIPWASRVN